MTSYEKGLIDNLENDEDLPKKLDIPILRYFWQSNPITTSKSDSIPKFLRHIGIFKNFSDLELARLSRYMHTRTFKPKELIFDQGDTGVAFYLIYIGHVEIVSKDYPDEVLRSGEKFESTQPYILRSIAVLEKYDYFGELSVLQQGRVRTACAIAKDDVVLLGILKPDIDELIKESPVVAAKLLQSLSIIVSNRFSSMAKEMKILKYKIQRLEANDG